MFLKVADSHRNRSQLHKLSFMWPIKVSQEGPPEFDSGDGDAESQRDLLGDPGTTQLGLRRFIATTASMRSFSGPSGPGRRPRWCENNMRYFRFISTVWKRKRVEGFGPIAERRTRARRMNSVHKPAMILSTVRRLGRTLAAAIEDDQLMPDQHGLGNNGAESTGPCQSGHGDDQMNE
jgi:hypothetical protein